MHKKEFNLLFTVEQASSSEKGKTCMLHGCNYVWNRTRAYCELISMAYGLKISMHMV